MVSLEYRHLGGGGDRHANIWEARPPPRAETGALMQEWVIPVARAARGLEWLEHREREERQPEAVHSCRAGWECDKN